MQKELIEKNALLKLSFEFSLLILNYCDVLDEKRKFAISRQLVRSGTSIGANAMEAQNAESKADFVHKIKLPPRKQTKRNTGSASVSLPKAIRSQGSYPANLQNYKEL